MQQKDGNMVVGLDIGTTKICAMAGRENKEGLEIFAIGSAPSNGLRKGIVVDIDLTVASIKKALKEAEDMAGFTINSVYTGIAGGHIKGFNGYGSIDIKGKKITEDDMERLMDAASAVYVPVERDILHVIPSGFKINGNNVLRSPLGMYGDRLEASVHIVSCSVSHVQNLIRCCEMAGVEVADILLEPLASAEAVLTADEKQAGVALIDLGGGTTDIAIYREGVLRHAAVLALGGNHLSNDIAIGFGIPLVEAERIKKEFSGACSPGAGEDRGLTLPVSDIEGAGPQIHQSDLKHLTEIIGARCEEIIDLVREELGLQLLAGISSAVLTGGTSMMRGMPELAAGMLGLPVRIGRPEPAGDKCPVNSPVYATGVGLVRYGLSETGKGIDIHPASLTSAGIYDHMKQWVSGFINKIYTKEGRYVV